jgi:hypothetical protein
MIDSTTIMDELLELRTYIEARRYDDALLLIGEMEEMAKEDKLNKISSFAVVLLVHLIKQHAEQRTTRSWDASIYVAVFEIGKSNKRKKSGGYYATNEELRATLAEAWPVSVRRAALEAFEGRYEAEELERMINKTAVLEAALQLILEEQRT